VIDEPLAENIEDILDGMGITVLETGGDCDATLMLDVFFTAKGENYKKGGFLYTGAELQGEALLVSGENELYRSDLYDLYKPPTNVLISGEPPKTPENAPLHYAWDDPILDVLTKLWGEKILIQATSIPLLKYATRIKLGKLGDQAVIMLVEAFSDPDGMIRWGAAEMLAEFRYTGPILMSALENPDPRTRILALRSLEMNISGEDALQDLIQVLKSDPDPEVRAVAAEVLGSEYLYDEAEPAVPALVEALSDVDKYVRKAAQSALVKITGKHYPMGEPGQTNTPQPTFTRPASNTPFPTDVPRDTNTPQPTATTKVMVADLSVTHLPNPTQFVAGGPSDLGYTCQYKTTVKAEHAGVYITEFGMEFQENGAWVHSPSNDGKPWGPEDFEDWYSCSEAYIPAGESCTDAYNWNGNADGSPVYGRWYFRGVDDHGNQVEASEVIYCQAAN
jgi:hypothetical protein